MTRAAALDIGTNSTRLLVAETDADGYRRLVRRTEVTRLGRGVDRSRRLSPEGVAATLTAVRAFGEAARELGVTVGRGVATSAVRDALDRDAFLAAATDAFGYPVEVISGIEEAELSFEGAVRGVEPAPGSVLVVDPGGGSTEFVYGTVDGGTRVLDARSVDVGSTRVTERVLPDRPPPSTQLATARRWIAERIGDVPRRPVGTAIGVAGTFTSLAAMDLGLDAYDEDVVHGHRLGRDAVARLVGYLAGLTVEATARIPSLQPGRAPVILGGALIVEVVMSHLDLDEVVVSEHDILDGIARRLLAAS